MFTVFSRITVLQASDQYQSYGMSVSRDEPGHYSQARSLPMPSPFPHNAYAHLLDDLQSDNHPPEPVRPSESSSSYSHQSSLPPLGKPRAKHRFSVSDLSVTALSLVCLAMAVMAVANEAVSWRLGVANNQLIAVGFLLSIMNLCLGSVTSTFFLLIEARFGSSILQNYDGILRNKPMAPRLGLPWRVVLSLFLVLPIVVSVAYKTFKGGQSLKGVKSADYVSIPTNYGMVATPGLMVTGQNPTGLAQYFNATQHFQASTSPVNGSEPPLPQFPKSYGYNVLLLNGNSTAVLDILHPDFIAAVQDVLAVGESWVVSAPVIGTVATLSTFKAVDPSGFATALQSACTSADDAIRSAGNANWTYNSMDIWAHDTSSLWLLDQDNLSDQSMQYVSFFPLYRGLVDCPGLLPYIQLYNIYRQQCQGTWSITRAGIELTNGSCDGAPLSADKQQMITWNNMKLPYFYLPTLLDFLNPFSPFGSRNQSDWNGPYMATSMAAMVWSRVVAIDTIGSLPLSAASRYDTNSYSWTTSAGTRLNFEDIKLLYRVDPSDQTILYIRPTLQKSPLLYFILAFQPLLTVAILGAILTMHSVPLDKGFGLVSILSGIDRRTLDILSGASLSGELTHRVKLLISPTDNGRFGKLDFRAIHVSQDSKGKEQLRRDVLYR